MSLTTFVVLVLVRRTRAIGGTALFNFGGAFRPVVHRTNGTLARRGGAPLPSGAEFSFPLWRLSEKCPLSVELESQASVVALEWARSADWQHLLLSDSLQPDGPNDPHQCLLLPVRVLAQNWAHNKLHGTNFPVGMNNVMRIENGAAVLWFRQ